MADKINAIKIKQPNGSYSDQIPISVLVQNVQWDQDHSLLDALGSVDLSSSGKGNLQHQIDELDEDKISHDDFNSQLDEFLSQQIKEDTESWLEENINPGEGFGITTNLTLSGWAADAKAVGDAINAKTFPIDSTLSDNSTNPVQNKVITSAISELNGSLEEIGADAELVAGWSQVGTVASDSDFLYPYNNAKSVKLASDETISLTIHGITISDIDHMGDNPTYRYIEEVSDYDGEGKKYRITELNGSDRGADTYLYSVTGVASGLKVGHKYRIHVKCSDPSIDRTGGGKYARALFASKTCNTWNPLNHGVFVGSVFTATVSSGTFMISPFMTNNANVYMPSLGEETIIEDVYINEVTDDVNLYTHEDVFSETVTGKQLRYDVNGKKFVASATGSATVSTSEASSRVQSVNGVYPDAGGDILCKSHLQGKTLVCLGDSITEAGVADQNYSDYPSIISYITGMNVYNFGVGTTRMSLNATSKPVDGASFATLADQIYSEDWSILTALSTNRQFGKYARVANILPTISTLDWNDVDYVLVSFGTNDSYDANIDNSQDKYDKTAIVSAFRYGYEKIMSKYPHLRFIVLTPIYRHFTGDADTDDTQLTTGYYLYEIGDALMECCEKEYHIPSIDMYNLCGFNKLTYERYLNSDGLHPTYEGQVEMGRVASAQIMSKL